MKIDRFGIWYIHAKGKRYEDEVGWIWWWMRKENSGKKWYSIGFSSSFESLKEIDETWDGYIGACRECFKE